MKKVLGFFFVAIVAVFSHADTLTFTAEVEGLANGDTFDADAHWHSALDSIKSIVNGRLTDFNWSDTMKLTQRKIDSTSNHASDWIYNYTRRLWRWSSSIPQLRSGRGIDIFLNDTTTNSSPLRIYSDSTKYLFAIGEDTIRTNRPTSIDSVLVTGNDSVRVYVPAVFHGTIETDTVLGLDVLKGNPIIDSIQRVDRISGNPYVDSILGPTNMTQVKCDTVRALAGNGLHLQDDGGNGIFVKDGGNIGIDTTSPGNKLHVNGTTQTDSLYNTKGYKGTTATLSGAASVDSAYATKAVKAARGIFDSIQIGGGTWVKLMDIGGFVMKIYNGADTICNDSVSYYAMNDNVSLSVPLTGEKVDGAVVKYLATGLPDNLRPATAREIFMPCSTTFTSLGGGQTMLSHVRMKIPTATAAPCTVIVTSTASAPPPSVFLMTSNISYSLN